MKKAHHNISRWRIILVLMILCFASQACLHLTCLQDINTLSTNNVRNLIWVPLTYQSNDYTCGVSALQSILYYYGKEGGYDDLAKALEPDPIKGTNYRRMAKFARSLGFRADVLMNMSLEDLKKFLDSRKPVLVAIQAWPDSPVQWSESWNEGHYVVAIGYDERNIYFMDPSTLGHYTFIPILEFLDRWHDIDGQEELMHFGMVITCEGATIYAPDIIRRMD
jgi:predicted double-glycine peptidase